MFILVYGSGSDWVRNILAAGGATLTVSGEDVELVNPRLVDAQDAWQALPKTAKRPPGFLRITEYLRVDRADG